MIYLVYKKNARVYIIYANMYCMEHKITFYNKKIM